MEHLEKEELLLLLTAYDAYIQNAHDEDLPRIGWRPVCIEEFYEGEFQQVNQILGQS